MSTKEFGELIVSNQEFLHQFAMRLTKSKSDSDDLTQETFYKALQNKEKFEEGTNLKGWLWMIMKNSFINSYRKKKTQNAFTDGSSDNYFINLTVPGKGGQSDELVDIEFVMKQVHSIEKEYLEPFMMFFNGFQYEEIAEIMAIPLGTVKSRTFMARKRMKSKLKFYTY